MYITVRILHDSSEVWDPFNTDRHSPRYSHDPTSAPKNIYGDRKGQMKFPLPHSPTVHDETMNQIDPKTRVRQGRYGPRKHGPNPVPHTTDEEKGADVLENHEG